MTTIHDEPLRLPTPDEYRESYEGLLALDRLMAQSNAPALPDPQVVDATWEDVT